MIPMYKPFLPPQNEINKFIRKIYINKVVTNNGPLIKELEVKLKEIIDVKHLWITGNATIGLQMAIRSLDIKKSDIINSAFSYVAAPSAIISNNCKNVFVDINPDTYCINPDEIEKRITSNTKAILPTHVFNTSCDVEKIEKIAKKHQLKVIYDAAHSFGIKYKNKSIFNYGDISVCSLHTFKYLSMIEGGFVATNDNDISESLYETRYFGVKRNNLEFVRVGFNGKNSEFHAAVGLASLKYIELFKQRRIEMYELYSDLLKGFPIKWQKINPDIETNHAYLPLVFKSKEVLSQIQKALAEKDIACRRYFNPSLNNLVFFEDTTPMYQAENLSDCILCIPFYYGLKNSEIIQVCNGIKQALENLID